LKNTNLIIVGITALGIGAAVGFFGGIHYQKTQTRRTLAELAGRSGNGNFRTLLGNRNGNARGGAVIGEILSTDDQSLTVKLADGSSKIVLLTSTTAINKATVGSKSDLTAGTRVAVFGQGYIALKERNVSLNNGISESILKLFNR